MSILLPSSDPARLPHQSPSTEDDPPCSRRDLSADASRPTTPLPPKTTPHLASHHLAPKTACRQESAIQHTKAVRPLRNPGSQQPCLLPFYRLQKYIELEISTKQTE